MPYFSRDDIAQIGTPPGPSPVGAIRVSGDDAFAVVTRVAPELRPFLQPSPRRIAVDGRMTVSLAEPNRGLPGAPRVLACPARFFLMPAPASYTREDVVEIHLPGSPALLRAALRTLVEAGARAAAPGEFTFRAFRSGRLGLSQAEAVEELIRSGNDAERRLALSRLGDDNLDAVRRWRDKLMDAAALVEAALDFSEEELEPDVERALAALTAELAASVPATNGSAELRAGRRITLAGLTNAGKSSLFNALLCENAVIVSPEASTTRDRLSRRVRWDDVELELSDAPGYDPDTSGQGGEAASRGFRQLGGEELALWVLDASRRLDERDARFAGALSGGVYIVLNKSDLPAQTDREAVAALLSQSEATVLGGMAVSAATGEGVDALRREIARLAATLRDGGRWNRRETLELAAARESCRLASVELGGGRLELAAEELRHGVSSFSRLLGEGYAEEALGRIFSRFCIGK